MQTLERFLALLFGTIVVMLLVTNAGGVADILKGFASFTGETVGAFRGRGV